MDEVPDLIAGIGVAGVIVKSQTQFYRQALRDFPAILGKEGQDVVPAVVVQLHVIQVRLAGRADQEVGEVVACELPGESVSAVVIGPEKAQGVDGTHLHGVKAEFESVAALDPAQAIGKLVGPRLTY